MKRDKTDQESWLTRANRGITPQFRTGYPTDSAKAEFRERKKRTTNILPNPYRPIEQEPLHHKG